MTIKSNIAKRCSVTITDVERLVSTLGVPVSILVAMAFSLWRIVKWLQPHADKLLVAQVNLTTTCEHTIRSQAEQLRELKEHTIDPRGPCQRTVASMTHLSHAVESLGDKCPDVVHHAMAMRRVLEE